MSNPTRLVLVRHGQAQCNVDGIIGGPLGCTGLTEHGRSQTRLLARRLGKDHTAAPFGAVYTTPLPRTRDTADIIATELAVTITIDDDLREPDYGEGDGQAWTDVVAAFGDIPALHPDIPIATDAESWATYLARATAALRRIVTRHRGETILIVGHGETITAAAHLFLDLPMALHASAAFAAHNTGITIWEQQPLAWTRPDAGWRWTMLVHNDTSHLTNP